MFAVFLCFNCDDRGFISKESMPMGLARMLRIADARKAKGWKQEDLAARIGVTQQAVQRCETGKRDVKTSMLVWLSRALDVSVADLLCMEDADWFEHKLVSIPLFVDIAAGAPMDMEAARPKVTVTDGEARLVENSDFVVSYRDNVNAGTATVTVTGKVNYTGTKPATFSIAKASNGIAARAAKKTVKLKKVRKKKRTVAPLKVTGAQGRLSFANASTAKKAKKLKVNKKTGKTTVPKGTKRGTYKVKVRVTAAGDANHEPATRTVTCKVVVG